MTTISIAVAGLVFGSALTIFTLQNASVMNFTLFGAQFAASTADVLLAAVALGALSTLLAFVPAALRGDKRIKELEAQKREVENELAKYRIIIPVAPPSQHMSPITIEQREPVHVR